MAVQLEEFKQRQRAIWDAGDYATVSVHIADVGERLVEGAGVERGMSVLDVACGTGNAAIPAARSGARVTGLDLVPKLLEQGRAKAEAAGLEIEWVEGDAEELPFENGSFDRVLSIFGHMFAPHHRGERHLHASAAGLRLATDPVGQGGLRARDLRVGRVQLRLRAPRELDRG